MKEIRKRGSRSNKVRLGRTIFREYTNYQLVICREEPVTAKMDSEHLHALNITAHSEEMPAEIPPVSGIEWNDFADRNITVAEMVSRMKNTGFQATAVAEAVEIIEDMVRKDKCRPLLLKWD